jgi:tripartite ATP-independent transporter DctM subunit
MDYLAAWMFLALTILLMAGFPVTFTLLGVSLTFGMIGFGWDFFNLLPLRIWGRMGNVTLAAVPLFVFMGVMLERSGLAEELLDTMGLLFGRLKGGLAISVVVVGALLGASTGIVGATVVTMGLLAVPTMLRRGYQKELATGTVSASGTLGQIIPPSIVLVLIGDIVGVSVGDLFIGAVLPGLLLVGLFIVYILIAAYLRPGVAPAISKEELAAISPRQLAARVGKALFPPLFLMMAVLGSIFAGVASPTEAAAVGAVGATLLTIANNKFNMTILHDVMHTTVRLTCMVFIILCGAAAFGLVFRGLGGDGIVRDFLGGIADQYSHGAVLAIVMLFLGGIADQYSHGAVLAIVMLLIFFIGFFLDFIEITFIHVPVLAPIMIDFGYDPVWFCILLAVNLQTSFLTPPFGFSLFYLKAVTPPEVTTGHIYRGIIPFVFFQLIGLAIVVFFPQLATWLPDIVFGP